MRRLSIRRKIWDFLSLRHVFTGTACLPLLLKTDPQRIKPQWIIGLLALEQGQERFVFKINSTGAKRMAWVSQMGCSHSPSGVYYMTVSFLQIRLQRKPVWKTLFHDSYFLAVVSKCFLNSPENMALNSLTLTSWSLFLCSSLRFKQRPWYLFLLILVSWLLAISLTLTRCSVHIDWMHVEWMNSESYQLKLYYKHKSKML